MTARPTGAVCPLLLTLLTLQPPALEAQTAPTIPTFSVSVTEASELVEEVGTIRRISRADIEARNARTLDEALRLLPGVHVRTGGDGTPRIDVRGFRSRHVLLLMNGVPVNSTADGQFDPARIATDAIREIKISYGSSSVLYGDTALAAVIEITTIDGASEASLHASAGTPDQVGVGGRFARRVRGWSLTGSATGYRTDAFRLPGSFAPTTLEDGRRRENSDRDRGEIRGAAGYRFSPGVALSTEWAVGTGSYGVPGSTVAGNADIFAQAPRFERVEDYRSAAGQVSLIAAPWERVNLRAWAFRNSQREHRGRYDDATYSSLDDPAVAGTFDVRERTTISGGSALARFDLGRQGWLRVVVNARREAFESNGVIRDVPVGGSGGGGGGGGRGGGSGQATFDLRPISFDRHVNVLSSGAEWELRPWPRVGTVVGAAVNVQRRPDGTTETAPTWLAGGSYEATAALRLRASATRKVRMPSIDQLFNTASGNVSLRAEHAYGAELGADYQMTMTSSLGVAAFSTDARDFIERVSGSPFENQDRYRFRGLEVSGHTVRIPQLDLRAAYSFLDSEAVLPAGSRLLQTRPRHRGSLEWSWAPAPESVFRGAAYHTGNQRYDSRGGDPVQLLRRGHTLIDLGFTQTLARHYEVAVDVTNLFDRLYDQAYGLPREGRAAVLTLRARFD